MTYKSVVASRRGGPEVLQVIENDLREPKPAEAQVRVLATSVGRTDVNYRYGYSPLAPKPPFVPGYEIVGVVEAVGAGVTRVSVGDRVAALTGHGGYTEVIYLGQEHLVRVPPSLAPEDVATLVLNYATAYQMLHRVAKAKAGDRMLVIGASGGVGTALLELGRLAGLEMFGVASGAKRGAVSALGAVAIDYHTEDFVQAIRRVHPDGVDFVLDGVGGDSSGRSLAVLRRGGKLIGYAAPTGASSILVGLLKMALVNLLPNGKSAHFFGISALYARDKRPFMEDL
ncbi:MAG TPA: alcohol dehydrogenase catalytic domain-containing protein, partial [Spirochaetia bacterium]|nr:alcohol dehydrogenase catalytic domain-containing protein [Spirochaetia bacterium]